MNFRTYKIRIFSTHKGRKTIRFPVLIGAGQILNKRFPNVQNPNSIPKQGPGARGGVSAAVEGEGEDALAHDGGEEAPEDRPGELQERGGDHLQHQTGPSRRSLGGGGWVPVSQDGRVRIAMPVWRNFEL